jgi:hypothetical protein
MSALFASSLGQQRWNGFTLNECFHLLLNISRYLSQSIYTVYEGWQSAPAHPGMFLTACEKIQALLAHLKIATLQINTAVASHTHEPRYAKTIERLNQYQQRCEQFITQDSRAAPLLQRRSRYEGPSTSTNLMRQSLSNDNVRFANEQRALRKRPRTTG